MAQRAQVPKFGNWESEEVPYTTYFDNARKGKKSGQIYQIDPQDNIDAELKDPKKASEAKLPKHERHSSREENELRKSIGSPDVKSHKPSTKLEPDARKVPEVLRPRHDRRVSREEGEMRRFTDSPLRNETAGRRNSSNSPHHRHGGSSAGETPRRVGGRSSGISSPSWERKGTTEGSHGGVAPSTPGRSRLRSVTRGDDSPDRSPAVPKFGEWDETDPASAEGYTQVFNRVREEKHSETGKVPVMPTETSYSNAQKQYGNDDAKGCCCFRWSKR